MKFVKGHERELTDAPPVGLIFPMQGDVPLTSVEAIADRLRRTREALGYSQTKLCRRVGIGTNTWNQWEKARQRPRLDEAFKLCQELNLTLDWIYLGKAYGLPSDLVDKIFSGTDPVQGKTSKRRLKVAK